MYGFLRLWYVKILSDGGTLFVEWKENGELYGSIKPLELSRTIVASKKIDVKPSQIDIAKEINKIGNYTAKVNLHAEVQAQIHIEVVQEDKGKS